jgi:hypothetical protein
MFDNLKRQPQTAPGKQHQRLFQKQITQGNETKMNLPATSTAATPEKTYIPKNTTSAKNKKQKGR